MRRLAPVVLIAAIAGCGGTKPATVQSAATFWRQAIADHYHGTVTTGDQRGCVQTAPNRFSCTGYVAGQDVIGTVTGPDGDMKVQAHAASKDEIQAWFAKYPNGGQ